MKAESFVVVAMIGCCFIGADSKAEPTRAAAVRTAAPTTESKALDIIIELPANQDPGLPEYNPLFVEDGARIDVLFVYTKTAGAMIGGVQAVTAAADAAVSDFNEAVRYTYPQHPQGLFRIARAGPPQEVPDATPNKPGSLPDTEDLKKRRENAKADLVVLFHHNYDSPGVANIYCGDRISHRGKAFALISHKYVYEYMTPAHEIGHLFGAGHERERQPSNCVFGDSRGHTFTAMEDDGSFVAYGDLMAYGGVRQRLFSNPAVLFRGVPTGTSLDNNARALAATHGIIANYYVAEEPRPRTNTGPSIEILGPVGGSSIDNDADVSIVVRITDPDGVAGAELYWKSGAVHLKCPSQQQGGVSCSRRREEYTWEVDLTGTGPREFYVRAHDSMGTYAVSPSRTITVVE